MLVSQLNFKEKVPTQCPELYWELRKLGARPFQANWKSKAIHKFKEGQELSTGSIYKELRQEGFLPIEALKMEIVFWSEYDKTHSISTWEAGMLLHTENNQKRINYITSMKLMKQGKN